MNVDKERETRMALSEIESLNLNILSKICYDIAQDKGWWEDERTFSEITSLIHTEVSEAFEEYREGHEPWHVYEIVDGREVGWNLTTGNLHWKSENEPEGIPIEFADIIIRILDYCGRHDIDIMTAVQMKLMHNMTRDYRHGGKQA